MSNEQKGGLRTWSSNQSNKEMLFLTFFGQKIIFTSIDENQKTQICVLYDDIVGQMDRTFVEGNHTCSSPATPPLSIFPKPSGTFYRNACALVFVYLNAKLYIYISICGWKCIDHTQTYLMRERVQKDSIIFWHKRLFKKFLSQTKPTHFPQILQFNFS